MDVYGLSLFVVDQTDKENVHVMSVGSQKQSMFYENWFTNFLTLM